MFFRFNSKGCFKGLPQRHASKAYLDGLPPTLTEHRHYCSMTHWLRQLAKRPLTLNWRPDGAHLKLHSR